MFQGMHTIQKDTSDRGVVTCRYMPCVEPSKGALHNADNAARRPVELTITVKSRLPTTRRGRVLLLIALALLVCGIVAWSLRKPGAPTLATSPVTRGDLGRPRHHERHDQEHEGPAELHARRLVGGGARGRDRTRARAFVRHVVLTGEGAERDQWTTEVSTST